MAEERVQRRLAAILAADVVGYSRLMGVDEAGTRAQFNKHFGEELNHAAVLCAGIGGIVHRLIAAATRHRLNDHSW